MAKSNQKGSFNLYIHPPTLHHRASPLLTFISPADMATSPEGDGLFPDPEPFSPSIFLDTEPFSPSIFLDSGPFSPSTFLDLPPTPRRDGTGGGVPASSDDLVLPFISRILMEEEEDSNNQFFPDHPMLLQAQESYAQILSDAATARTDSTASGSSRTVSSSSSDDPVQLLLSPPYHDTELPDFTDDGISAFFLPAQDGDSPELEQSPAQLRTRSLPAGDGDDAALATVFFSKGDADAEMLNKAFLKGMEEAKKFLPSTNSLLQIDCEAEEEKEGINGRGRKDRDRLSWDDLEAETCRKSKQMVPEPEEAGEIVDQIIFNGLELCLNEMKALQITMGRETKKNTRKGKAKSGKGRSSTNEAVELSTLLIHCAQAVATDNRRSATELLRQIKPRTSPRGDATQRLAHCFAEGLEARLAGSGSQLYRSLMAERVSVVEYLKAYVLYLAACCFKMMAFKFSNMTICKTIAGRKKVHIVDYGIDHGVQWPSLLHQLTTLEGGPPEVRITGIVLPKPGFRPAVRVKETGRRLSNYARQLGVPFKFHAITARWDTVSVDDLNIDPDEVLIVNSIVQFGNLMDEGVDIDSPSPRDVVLRTIRKMQPDAFILYVMNVSYSAPMFVSRFREALFFYSAMFDMLDTTAPRDSHQRFLVERGLFRLCALNVVACEGMDRVERPETYKQWQVRNHRAGLRQLPLDPDTVNALRDKVREQYHKDFVIDTDHNWLLEGWKGRILFAMSTWVADDPVSEL